MSAIRVAALAALAALALAGCGESSEDPPKGSAAQRQGPQALADFAQLEEVRWRLGLASELWAFRRGPAALRYLAEARREYEPFSARVAAEDPRLNAEVEAAFERVEQRIRAGRTFDDVRDLLGPLSDQLLSGVQAELGFRDAAADPGAAAIVASGLLRPVPALYAGNFPESYGRFARAQSIARPLAPVLDGDGKDAVTEGLGRVRAAAFPEGVLKPVTPRPPPGAFAQRVDRALAALRERFDL